MSKTREWHTKAIYLIVALVMTLGLVMVPATAGAAGNCTIDSVTANPDHCLTPLDSDFTVDVTNTDGASYLYVFTWNYQYWQNEGEPVYSGDANEVARLFGGVLQTESVTTSSDPVTISHIFTVPGYYLVNVDVYDAGDTPGVDTPLDSHNVTIKTLGIIPSDIAYDVKGSCHKICVKGMNATATVQWSLVSGVNLDPADIIDCEDPAEGVFDPADHVNDPCIIIKAMARGDIHIYATVSGDECSGENITFHSEKKWGELHHSVLDLDADTAGIQCCSEYVPVPPTSTCVIEETLEDTVYATFYEVTDPMKVGHAIVHWWLFEDEDLSVLLAQAVAAGNTVRAAALQALIDMGYENTQDFIDELMDHIADREGALDNDHWAAHGKYNSEALHDLMVALGACPSIIPAEPEPFDVIMFLASNDNPATACLEGLGFHADTTVFTWNEDCPVEPPGPDGDSTCYCNFPVDWYFQNETPDSLPGEVANRGKAQATLSVDTSELCPSVYEKVMIVILVSYPGGTDCTDDPFGGENKVIIEKGKKQFHKTEVTEVKTPQLRWAGEKIVLEKDWSDLLTDRGIPGGYYVEYNLEYGSVGTLHPCGPYDYSYSEGLVFAFPDSYGRTCCILESEQAGEADVDAALYWCPSAAISDLEAGGSGYQIDTMGCDLVGEIGFLVYYLEFEDVILAENLGTDGDFDVTPLASFQELIPDLENAEIAVQVRGFFDYRHSRLMQTTRPTKELDVNGDGEPDYYLPAGRYVLPDDWWLIAGTEDVSMRPNWDLMDRANLDEIVSPADTNGDHVEELGPYDTAVRTASVPNAAAFPCIGPFNTLQQWTVADMWLTNAMVPADMTVAAPINVWQPFTVDLRNTVVPDGYLDWFDAPMPQALVIFDIVDSSEPAALLGLDKGNLEGYGFDSTDLTYQSPFYAVEIPAHWVIPGGYNWDSWGIWSGTVPSQGPYDYWTDLMLDSIIADTTETPVDTQDVEVYCDNHGIAGMQIAALDESGDVTITATAEFPYTPKRGKYGPRVSDEITATWGPIDLNPHFTVDDATPAVGQVVTFDPTTTVGGKLPYTRARWDWEGDGIWDYNSISEGTAPLDLVTHAYPADGLYWPCLEITDSSTPAVIRYECRGDDDPIVVGAGLTNIQWTCPIGSAPLIAPNPGAGRPFLMVDADPTGITASGGASLWGIYYLNETTGDWLYYIPGYGTSTLTELETDQYYYVIVSGACTLTIPQV
jgi:hypothetical protein